MSLRVSPSCETPLTRPAFLAEVTVPTTVFAAARDDPTVDDDGLILM